MEDTPRRTWDYALTVATVALLGSLGTQSLIGTGYVWWGYRTQTAFEQAGYPAYVSVMNAIAAPQVAALVVLLGLCVPKRLFSRRVLLGVSAAMLGAGAGAGLVTRSLANGLGAYLVLAALIQAAVVAMTVAGATGPSYMTEGRVTKVGSGLLHLGFVLFALVVVSLQRSTWMLPVFSAAAVCALGGSVLSFYANEIGRRLRARG